MAIEDAITLLVPLVATVISIWSLLLGSKHRSLESAQRYIDVLEKAGSLNDKSNFDSRLKKELEQTSHYFLWKSMSRLSAVRRSSFNYIGFLIFTSAGLGLSTLSAVLSFSEEGVVPILPLVGGLIIIISMGLMAFSRYESYMLESFIELRKHNLYVDSYSYSFLSKEKVLNESIVPVLLSFIISIFVFAYMETNRAIAIFGTVILIITIGNNIEMIKNDRWVKKEVDRLKNMPNKDSSE